jgi:hypothetical protein
MSSTFRLGKKSNYRFVIGRSYGLNKEVRWFFHKSGVTPARFETEREAAIAADKYLISIGIEPVNILKRAI